MRWQVYIHESDSREATVQKLKQAGFKVYLWKNSNRVTFEKSNGTESHISMFLLKNKIDGKLVKYPFPSPHESTLAFEYV
jgi:hypothetical protein